MPVSMVHIHHEGGGAPCTVAQAERFRHGGYCAPICTDGWTRWCSPEQGYATADWNGRDLTLCLSGDRHTGYGVTDHDLQVIHEAFMDFYNRGEVTATPDVVAHRDAGGSNATACPGDLAMARFQEIAAQCRAGAAPTPEPEGDDPMDLASALNHDGRPVVFQVGGDAQLYYRVRDAQGGSWGDWRDLSSGKHGFATVTAWTNRDQTPDTIEVWVTMKDGHTFQRYQEGADRASWSAWIDRTR